MKYQTIEVGNDGELIGVRFYENKAEVRQAIDRMVDATDDGLDYIDDKVLIYNLETGERITEVYEHFFKSA